MRRSNSSLRNELDLSKKNKRLINPGGKKRGRKNTRDQSGQIRFNRLCSPLKFYFTCFSKSIYNFSKNIRKNFVLIALPFYSLLRVYEKPTPFVYFFEQSDSFLKPEFDSHIVPQQCCQVPDFIPRSRNFLRQLGMFWDVILK